MSTKGDLKESHIYYASQLNRDNGFCYLNRQVVKILNDTTIFSHYKEFRKERELSKKEEESYFELINENPGKYIEHKKTRKTPICDKYKEQRYLENVKIALALEIHLKARLLKNGIVVHVIDNKKKPTLCKRQYKWPITIEELCKENGYSYPCNKNFKNFNFIIEMTIMMKTIMSEGYKKYLDIDEEGSKFRQIINDYIKLRNQIHYPIGIVKTTFVNKSDMNDELIKSINNYVINQTNQVIKKYETSDTPLPPSLKLKKFEI